ncbi:AsnC family transcriptional regulator [Halodesulfurarchaeum formicicum]|uniref:AsnC family transcriptional regulator n=1 Tax=Halodesulfurarchaeum formicicum TaxID=1873524 RepID=A0A1J1AD35_9EURY|nr:AsnC family transcriptional regulator [Halodesulfurarchaeum formicicum]APE95639.1 AsnC family transcriptional regulator [Halodesulfurarchaeum formicicum]
MHDLDETDLEILRLLVADARRPFREIAEAVDLSAPAVSDRVSRLKEQGVIRRFTADIDRRQLREGTPVLVDLEVAPESAASIRDAVQELDAVEHVYVTVDGHVLVHANAPGAVGPWLDQVLEEQGVRDVAVSLLRESQWSPTVGASDFALVCDECGNTVTSEGVTTRVGGEVKQFCCPSCESRYVERYEELQSDA